MVAIRYVIIKENIGFVNYGNQFNKMSNMDDLLGYISSAKKVNPEINANVAVRLYFKSGKKYDKEHEIVKGIEGTFFALRHEYCCKLLRKYLIAKMRQVENQYAIK